jgi:hypothetical protein
MFANPLIDYLNVPLRGNLLEVGTVFASLGRVVSPSRSKGMTELLTKGMHGHSLSPSSMRRLSSENARNLLIIRENFRHFPANPATCPLTG